MPLVLGVAGQKIKSADYNANFALTVLTDTSRTVTVTHTWSASQTFNAGFTGGASADIAINTNKFTVTAASGNVAIGGTLTVASTVTVTAAGKIFEGSGALTSAQYARFHSTGADLYFGIESSTGGGVWGGGTAYAAIFGTDNATPIQFRTNGTLALTIGTNQVATFAAGISATAGTFSGAVKSSSASGGVGYATGAGGAVTQSTNKNTGVTLNTICGAITMNNAGLAQGLAAGFVVTNSSVSAGDTVVVTLGTAGSALRYMCWAEQIQNGSFEIVLYNWQLAGTLSEAVVVYFTVIKGVTS